jgi:hypothetical protein
MTCNVPACARSTAGIVVVNCRLLTKLVANAEPFKYTIEVVRKSLPLMVNGTGSLPAVVLFGEIELTDGVGGQLQDVAIASAITSTHKTGDLAAVAPGTHPWQTGSDKPGAEKLKAIQENRRD